MEPRPARTSDVLPMPEVARRLGICAQTAYAAAARGELPARKIGRRWVVPVAAFEQWLGGKAREDGHPTTWPQ
ncbi:MAG: helix-turn-helix domain-containing protein [Thermomicrobiales bacterium]|nr:helix-turn-helix domain-containing protein [Thermomicrobiales bacterium]